MKKLGEHNTHSEILLLVIYVMFTDGFIILKYNYTAVYKECDLIICPSGHQDAFVLIL